MKNLFAIFLFLFSSPLFSQKDTSKYDRKEEIIDNNKRYRIHNNYLTVGPGFGSSNIRVSEQSIIGLDFNFHIRKQYFQAGILMSGNKFLSNNNLAAHLCYGYRKETNKYNFAFYGGVSYNEGIIPPMIVGGDTISAKLFRTYGFYANIQYIFKITYDIGFGGEAFAEFNKHQAFGGIKFILFFSGAYQGKAKVYNQHVKKKKS